MFAGSVLGAPHRKMVLKGDLEVQSGLGNQGNHWGRLAKAEGTANRMGRGDFHRGNYECVGIQIGDSRLNCC